MTAPLRDPVPDACLGVWRRISLDTLAPDGTVRTSDTATRAYWIQTPTLFADMRIPAGRPDMSGTAALSDLGASDLSWLARQQGIAGMTLAGNGLLHRRRQVDFQPTRGRDNTRRVRVEQDRLVEENPHGTVRETWQRLAGAEGDMIALRLQEEALAGGRIVPRKGYLLVVGDYFLFVRDRIGFTRQAASLEDLFEAQELGHDEQAALLDCEFSFGQRQGGVQPWIILLSTLPSREGRALFAPGQFEALRSGGDALTQRGRMQGATVTRRWSIQQWDERFSHGVS